MLRDVTPVSVIGYAQARNVTREIFGFGLGFATLTLRESSGLELQAEIGATSERCGEIVAVTGSAPVVAEKRGVRPQEEPPSPAKNR